LFLDLDQFKIINDSMGHGVGDQLLIGLANLLRGTLRASDTIARLGGDEFVVLLDNQNSDQSCIQAAARILEVLSQPFELDGHKLYTSTSIGVVPSLIGYATPSDVLRDADIALYQAKDRGKNCYEVFDSALRTQAIERLMMESEVRRALDREEFVLHYQPIFDLGNNRLTGFEALVRWNHPVRGLLPPGDFLPMCEESGLIFPLSKWILYSACRQMQTWRTTMPEYAHLSVSVNISGKQVSQPDFFEQIAEALQATGLAPEGLVLEITENVMIDNLTVVEKYLLQLHALGVRMQIDDFGTGYSSINYLSCLPISTIKIDRSFVQEIGKSARMGDLVRTMLRMAQDLGLEAIAEGIETQEQLDALQINDCPMGQGFMLARPMDQKAALKLMQDLTEGDGRVGMSPLSKTTTG
jgi:diguanylate cyclase (GGDEF)-like protein